MINYFSLYDIPNSFFIDKKDLKKKYYQLNKVYHPDFSKKPSEDNEILEKSSHINKGYEVLGDMYKRLDHILVLAGLDIKKHPSALFLGAMMDINEQIMQIETTGDADTILALKKETLAMQRQLEADLVKLFQEYEGCMNKKTKLSLMQAIHEKASEVKYILRLQHRMNKFA